MKRLVFILMMFIGFALSAQNPLPWSSGNFPIEHYLINKTDVENTWYEKGDSIYSAFEMDDKFYASGVIWSKSSMGFASAFGNDGSVSVKNGFIKGDSIYWGVCKKGVIHQLKRISTYKSQYGTNAIFIPTGDTLQVLDNPYFSLNPIWTDNLNYRIKKPEKLNRDYFLYNLAFTGGKDWRLQYPKYLSGLKWEMYYGSSKVTNDKKGFLNQAKFRFTQADVDRGYILLKLTGTPYKNSRSADTSRVYKIYWK